MDIGLIMKTAGVGLIVAVTCQILNKVGRDEQATMVSVAGIIIVIMMLVTEVGNLFDTIRSIFGL